MIMFRLDYFQGSLLEQRWFTRGEKETAIGIGRLRASQGCRKVSVKKVDDNGHFHTVARIKR